MAQFPSGLFGTQNILPTGREQMIQRAFAPQPQPTEPTKKPGLFGQGGIGRAIAGTIGDVLLQRGGNAPIYQPMQQYRQALADKLRMASLDRQNDMQDWLAKQQWERANPKPSDDQLTTYMKAAGIDPASAEGIALYRQAAENKANPPEWRQGPDGRFYRAETVEPQVLGSDLPPGWTIQPQSSSNAPSGSGNFMTAAQYKAIVDAKGPQAAEAWRRQYNIEVR
jgi:hypothetical protein